jgi:hypothetical protein
MERPHIQSGSSIIPRARTGDAITSRDAAARAAHFAQDHCESILGVLYRPMTCYTIARLTGLTHVQVARRLGEMEQKRDEFGNVTREGTIRPTGKTEIGESGSPCRLWERVA